MVAVAATVAVAGTLTAAAGFGALSVAAVVAVAALTPAAVIDVRTRRLPDRWVAAAAVATLTIWLATGARPPATELMVGAAVTAGPLLAAHLAAPTAMGFGDVKAAAVLGGGIATVDWRLGLVVLAVASGSAAVVALVRRRSTVAFGPYMVGAAWFVLLVGSTGVLGR